MRRSVRVMVFENFSPSPHQTTHPDEAARKRDDLGIAGHNGSVLEARRRHGDGVVGERGETDPAVWQRLHLEPQAAAPAQSLSHGLRDHYLPLARESRGTLHLTAR